MSRKGSSNSQESAQNGGGYEILEVDLGNGYCLYVESDDTSEGARFIRDTVVRTEAAYRSEQSTQQAADNDSYYGVDMPTPYYEDYNDTQDPAWMGMYNDMATSSSSSSNNYWGAQQSTLALTDGHSSTYSWDTGFSEWGTTEEQQSQDRGRGQGHDFLAGYQPWSTAENEPEAKCPWEDDDDDKTKPEQKESPLWRNDSDTSEDLGTITISGGDWISISRVL